MLFQCDPDIRLAGSEVYLDPAEPRRIGIISHGHADHIGRHEHFVATPATAAFLRSREGVDLKGTELPYRRPHAIGEFTVELFPAGHVLGSAMVRITCPRGTLAYTGDFKLSPSYTAEAAEVPEAEAVIMESTYGGSPDWIFPSREELRTRLVELVRSIIRRDKTPVLLAYSLGKAQEVAAMLRGEATVVMHPTVARISEIYERHGVDLGGYEIWSPQAALFGRVTSTTMDLRGKAVIVPPHMAADIRRVPRRETVALTGWALKAMWGSGADHGLPLSDHADYGELLDFAQRTSAKTVYVTHGAKSFAAELRRRGIRAEFLRRKPQMRLF